MGETKNAPKAQKTSWFKGMKAEFKKIVWPDQKSLTKQTIAVVSVSVALALIIKILDMVMTFGIDRLLTL
ncbi:preprotein translocase subunit SecE [Clostridiaceae bacterium Marseille-Q4145]|jgi:preprotein translocase subunit SecE|nr:preprotein translocase subunit SecE [Clostridiaceae bacterium Marseille-Q4145]